MIVKRLNCYDHSFSRHSAKGDTMKAFKCRMCGECCYGEGGVFVVQDEIERISSYLNITSGAFLSQYCEKKHGRFYLKLGPDNFCIFFRKEKSCLIHPVKPARCSLWPFYPAIINDKENWEMAQDACPGINPHSTFEEFVRQSKGNISKSSGNF